MEAPFFFKLFTIYMISKSYIFCPFFVDICFSSVGRFFYNEGLKFVLTANDVNARSVTYIAVHSMHHFFKLNDKIKILEI